MAAVKVEEPNDIVLASTTSSEEELEFAANNDRDARFTPSEEGKGKSGDENSSKTGSDSATEQDAGATKTKDDEDSDKDLPKGVRNRFDKLTRIGREAEERAAALATEVAELKAKLTPTEKAKVEEEDPEPKLDDFKGKPIEDYLKAQTKWILKQEGKATATKAAEEQRKAEDTQEQTRVKAVWDGHVARVNEAKAKHADWDETIEAIAPKDGKPSIPISMAAALTMFALPNSAEVMFYLAKNPDEAREIFKKSVELQSAEMGRISYILDNPPPVKRTRTNAPPPIVPERGGSAAGAIRSLKEVGDDPNGTDDYIAQRIKEKSRK